MNVGLDHAVVLVGDLETAVRDYRALGFTVLAGGTHAGGLTHNALVPFADGTYLELLAFTRPGSLPPVAALDRPERTPLDRRFVPRAGREGLIDLAVWTGGLEQAVAGYRASGDARRLEGPVPGERVRPDGTRLAWRMAFPEGWDLPFLIEDVTARDARVPGGEAAVHDNGIGGMRRVVYRVPEPGRTAATLRALVGLPPDGEPTADFATVVVRGAGIDFTRGTGGPAGPSVVHLAGRGDGAVLDRRLTHGAHLVVE